MKLTIVTNDKFYYFYSVPISPPQDVIVKVLSTTSLTISWAPPSIEDSRGYILGYHILIQVPANGLDIMITTADTTYTRTGTFAMCYSNSKMHH